MRALSVYVNGAIVRADSAGVSVFDRGLLYGDGLYETIRVRHSRLLRFDLHIQRLQHGASVLGIPLGNIDVRAAVSELLEANGLRDARVRVTLTRGNIGADNQPNCFITAVPLPEHATGPIKVAVSSYRRDETSVLCGVKTLNCLASVMAEIEAGKAGADDAILLNTQGRVAEATTANVFLVTGRRLLTPALDQGCLPGTVRSALLALASELGIEPVESAIEVDTLFEAEEIFLTSAIRLVRQVAEVDGRLVGNGGCAVSERVRNALLREEEYEPLSPTNSD
jgi:branched-chain amino acid aminotransferase